MPFYSCFNSFGYILELVEIESVKYAQVATILIYSLLLIEGKKG